MDERYSVSPWFSNPDSRSSCGRALVLPGGGYTVGHTALFWACQVLAQVGWTVITMRWHANGLEAPELRGFVERGAELLDAEAGGHDRTLVLGKSLGTYAAKWASVREYPAIWLTPVMTDEFVAEALRTYTTHRW